MVQERNLGELEYQLLKSEGPDHCKVFTSQAVIGGVPYGVGSGRNKKLAEQGAAYQAILKLK